MKAIHARIDAAVQAARTGEAPAGQNGEGGGTAETAAPLEGAQGAAPAAPASGQQTPTNIVETAEGGTPAEPSLDEQERASKRALIEARLAEARERRKAAEERKAAEQARKEAEQARTEALTEKQKYDALRTGTFKETLEALGRDPLETFKEMQREAIEANTPEAELRRMRADFEKSFGEKLKPLEETVAALKAENERLKAETERAEAEKAARAEHERLTRAFTRDIEDEAFKSLRVEYDDADIFAYVQGFVEEPKAFFDAAKTYNVPLTDPARGFTMREILLVLKAAQDAHDQGRQQRQARFAPNAPAAPSAPKTATVNGTAERRNAGQTIGSDLAGERASPGKVLSRRERVQAEIDRLSGR